MLRIVFLSQSRNTRQCKNIYYTWSRLRDGRQLCIYRVITDNRCELQHPSSHVEWNLWCKTREPNAEVPFDKETNEARLTTDSRRNNSKRPSLIVYISTKSRVSKRSPVFRHTITISCWYQQYLLFLSSRVHGLHWKFSRSAASVSVHKIRAAYCHCFASCHLLSWWFHSALRVLFDVHYQRWQLSVQVLVSPSLQPRHQFHHRLVTVILKWSVRSILAMLLRYWSRDWLRSNICVFLRCRHLLDTEVSKYRASMCFVRCPAPRSMKQFAVELALCKSIFIQIPRSWIHRFQG